MTFGSWNGGYGGVDFKTAVPYNKDEILETHLGGKNYGHAHGAPYGLSLQLPFFYHYPLILRTNRNRLNGVAVFWNVIVPWIFFCFTLAMCSFSFRFNQPLTFFVVLGLVLLCSICSCACLVQIQKIRQEREPEMEDFPMWLTFLSTTCFLAVLSAILLGFHNYDAHMSTVYQYESLATYKNVEPASYVGQQLVDAGRIVFNDGTRLDLTKSMGFKDTDMYCVAPIVSTNTTADTFVDFWAVGKGCCSGTQADFHCENYNNAQARGGLRLLDEEARPFYRLAVQQAEATYGIMTRKPLFFSWSPDPVKYIEDLHHAGITFCITCIVAYLVVQCFLVACAALVFAKIYPNREEHVGH